jgi:hypothetical protein
VHVCRAGEWAMMKLTKSIGCAPSPSHGVEGARQHLPRATTVSHPSGFSSRLAGWPTKISDDGRGPSRYRPQTRVRRIKLRQLELPSWFSLPLVRRAPRSRLAERGSPVLGAGGPGRRDLGQPARLFGGNAAQPISSATLMAQLSPTLLRGCLGSLHASEMEVCYPDRNSICGELWERESTGSGEGATP